ncbi:MAG: hypothetical protein KC933_42875, partial [Myxococcales bacterium]|nr:hypothetical protein [Myxococcales bacterium]
VAEPGARAAGLILARPSGADRERLGRFAAPAALAEVQIELDDDFLIDAVVAAGAVGRADDGPADAWPADGLGETDRATYLERLRAWLGQEGRERSPEDV